MRCPRCNNGVLVKDGYGDAPQCFTCGYYYVVSIDIIERASREVIMSGSTIKALVDPNDYEK